jgi:hypothetical protein
MIKKLLAIFLSLSFCGLTLLLANDQDLVELAKKEKARRESLKGQKARVITNKDLENLTKTPALTLSGQTQFTGSEEQAPQVQSSGSTPSVAHRVTVENPPEISRPEAVTQESGHPSGEGADTRGTSLEDAWKRAKEYVELLTLKMNSLWQEFYSLNDMKSRDYIQLQISETYEKLLKAQEEETQLRLEYEKQVNQKKSESASPIWIK